MRIGSRADVGAIRPPYRQSSPRPHRAADEQEAEMTHQTPTFHPRSAFAWTLRGGEFARDEARRKAAKARSYETPTFDPRGAFAWTLRGGEVARRERQARLAAVA
jgi:hypothetical protein